MTMETATIQGRVSRISGPVAVATGMTGARMYEVVRVGVWRLLGEIVRIDGDTATIQVYEDTTGLHPGEPVESSGAPLEAELGPGLLGAILDGTQRPLPALLEAGDPFISRGLHNPALSRGRHWGYRTLVRSGDEVEGGDVLGEVAEGGIVHRVLAPPDVNGRVVEVYEGELGPDDVVARLEALSGGVGRTCTLAQRWPVRRLRPHQGKLDPYLPLVTGQRVIDTFFPVAKGGTAVIPGGFGTGKTVIEQTLAKCADADVVVFVGCGERGNEMAEVLANFPDLTDRRTGGPLSARTVLIANTSNMPVAAREASVYTGMTIAEYYRDMGYHVALLIDSTSRWGEALREVSGRLEEMPGEEGFPAYLSSRIAELYERAGQVRCLGRGSRVGSVTLVGAVSPPGGDFSEPVTQGSLRVAGTFWALDVDLAHRRHFPAISWAQSYSLYLPHLAPWYRDNVAPDYDALRGRAMALLQREAEVQAIVQLVGTEALPEEQQAQLAVGRMLREDCLQQSAYHPEDAFCSLDKGYAILRAVLACYDAVVEALGRGAALAPLLALPEVAEIARLKEATAQEAVAAVERLVQALPGRMRT